MDRETKIAKAACAAVAFAFTAVMLAGALTMPQSFFS